MLNVLREKKNSPIIAAFLGAIILTFIFFFGQSWQSGAGRDGVAAKVNGATITEREFQQRYASVYRSYAQQYGGQFDRKQAESMDLRKKVLDSMIQAVLLADLAREKGLAVDDEALRKAILEDESFRLDGAFNKEQYERVLNANGLSAADYEAHRRQLILAEKLSSVVQGSAWVSEAELRQAFELEKSTLNVAFVRVPVSAVASQAPLPSAEEAEAWIKATADAEEQITKYYTKNKRAKYDVPKKLHARHILLRSDKSVPPDVRQQKIDELKKIRADILANKISFEDAAAKHSEDDSNKTKGGDLGFFAAGQMVGPFEEAAFGLKPGELSQLVETGFGFHLIKLEEIKEPIQRKIEDVRVEIAQELAREGKAEGAAQEKAKEILAALKAGKTLAEAVPENDPMGLKVDETNNFPPGRDFVPKIGADKALAKALWKLTKESPLPAEPLKVDGGWVVAQLKERTTPSPDDFEKSRQEVLPRLMFEKRTQVMEAWAEALKKSGKITINENVLRYDDTDARS